MNRSTFGAALAAAALAMLPAALRAAVNVQVNADGTRHTAVLVSGASATKYDLVFIGDGFTSTQQADFNARVDDAVQALRNREPYGRGICAFNIWRVNVISAESGVDHPRQGISRNTELDCRYGNNAEAERCIRSDSPAKCFEAAGHAPDSDAVFVLVNDTQWGGCAGSLVFSSIAPGFAGIITHELGHKIPSLADEYDCYLCDGTDSNRLYAGPEPSAANLTMNLDRATTKWHDLIAAATPLPTTVDTPAGVVGLWAGGGYFARGIFRPQTTCHMRTTGSDFCAVCARTLADRLRSRCTFCEWNPTSVACWVFDLRRFTIIRWRERFRIRWPIPPCLTCPPPDVMGDRVRLRVTGVPNSSRLNVLDATGRTVASGKASRGAVSVEFVADPSRGYDAELVSAGKPNGKLLKIGAQLERNGAVQQLPDVRR